MQVDKTEKIIMKGFMGSSGAALFASSHMEELYARFRKDYVEENMKLIKADTDSDTPVSVLDALYALAKEHRCGYEVELRKVPVRQFTIEICELFGLNPFELEGNIRICAIKDDGTAPDSIESGTVIGHTTEKLEKVYVR